MFVSLSLHICVKAVHGCIAVDGCAFGVVVLGQNAAMTVGPPIAGMLRDTTGDYWAVLVMWASVAFVGAMLAIGLWYDDTRSGEKLERPVV